ncbi:MAG TPA: tRNA (guanosine(37)-N1)-methyltransferase TrmD [Lachnospiraceae bacterium]|nr:tRNA (guanosine(37)-N1)-methyltransferase TrmD [Lachnospiraceae bacterium]
MDYHVLTLFPDMILQGLKTSIIGRAIEEGTISLDAVNIRDFTIDKHGRTDDYPYGGGAGMVMQAQPIYDAYQSIRKKLDYVPRVIYLTPQGRVFSQQDAKELSVEKGLIFLCGHYEGVDERVLEEIVTDNISIGDFVVTGGELPAMIMIDAISRMIPGVLHNGESAEDDSFGDGLLEFPQYSRPEIWNGKQVPMILLSGDHAKVDAWRREQSLLRTAMRRPDLLSSAQISPAEKIYIEKILAKKNDL